MAMSSRAPVERLKPDCSIKACWSSKSVPFSRPHSPSCRLCRALANRENWINNWDSVCYPKQKVPVFIGQATQSKGHMDGRTRVM